MSGLILLVGSDGFTLYLYKHFFKITITISKYQTQILNYLKDVAELFFHTFTLPFMSNCSDHSLSSSFHSFRYWNISLTDLSFFVFSVGNIINRTNNQPILLFTIEPDSLLTSKLIGTYFIWENYCILKSSLKDLDHRTARFHPKCKRRLSHTDTRLDNFYPLM